MNQTRVNITPSARGRPLVVALAVFIWITLILRLGLAVEEQWRAGDPLFWALGRFGYFTVLTTLLAALSVTAGLFSRRGVVIGSLASVSFAGLVTTSLVMVALVYTAGVARSVGPSGAAQGGGQSVARCDSPRVSSVLVVVGAQVGAALSGDSVLALLPGLLSTGGHGVGVGHRLVSLPLPRCVGAGAAARAF